MGSAQSRFIMPSAAVGIRRPFFSHYLNSKPTPMWRRPWQLHPRLASLQIAQSVAKQSPLRLIATAPFVTAHTLNI